MDQYVDPNDPSFLAQFDLDLPWPPEEDREPRQGWPKITVAIRQTNRVGRRGDMEVMKVDLAPHYITQSINTVTGEVTFTMKVYQNEIETVTHLQPAPSTRKTIDFTPKGFDGTQNVF